MSPLKLFLALVAKRRLLFLSTMLVALAYYWTWTVWKWSVWPAAFFMLVAGPWTFILVHWDGEIYSLLPRGFGLVFGVAFISVAFAFNVTLLSMLWTSCISRFERRMGVAGGQA